MRHRIAAIAAAVALATLSGTLIFALARARVAANERNHAVSLASRKAAVTEFLGTLITEATEAGKPVTITEMLARSEKLALADTSSSPENRAAVLAVIGARYGALGNYPRAAQLAEKGLALLVDSHADTQHHACGRRRDRAACAACPGARDSPPLIDRCPNSEA